MTATRIEEFERELAVDRAAALARLAGDLESAGGPIVEEQSADPSRVTVTFVATNEPEAVSVRCELFGGLGAALGMPMQQVDGTDVWYVSADVARDVSVTYSFLRDAPKFDENLLALMQDEERFGALVRGLFERSFADPFNPDRLFPLASIFTGQASTTPSAEQWESVLTLPGASPFVWHEEPLSAGRTESLRIRSNVFDNERTVTVWTPPGHDPGKSYPVLILLDGEGFLNAARADRILDNLVGGGHVQPLVAIFVHNASPMSRMTELPCNPALGQFIADELLPSLRREYSLSDDPALIAVGGSSLGGLAASWLAFERPDTFGNVFSMSGSFWWGRLPDGVDSSAATQWTRDNSPEWLTRQYANTDRKPVRFWLQVGSLEEAPLPAADGLTMVSANRRFADVLTDKGYEVLAAREDPGGHDFANWRRALPDALVSLFGPG